MKGPADACQPRNQCLKRRLARATRAFSLSAVRSAALPHEPLARRRLGHAERGPSRDVLSTSRHGVATGTVGLKYMILTGVHGCCSVNGRSTVADPPLRLMYFATLP